MNEAKIRDEIAKDLSILESSLQLVETEYYLPSAYGTRGFVDILARDNNGLFVIIEIKRSDKSAREAMHEILKYAEGLKEKKCLKSDEIRAIVVSTEWRELIVPFSSFIEKIDFELLGYELHVNDSLELLSTKRIKPLELRNERMLSDLHMYYLYSSEKSLAKGIISIKECYKKKGVNNYLLVKLKCIDDSFYMIYTTSQCFSDSEYLKIISSDQESYEDFDHEYFEQLSGIDRTNYLHGIVILDSQPWPYNEVVNVGSPAKFGSDILENGWEIIEILRGGAFSDNELLDDELILDELKGYEGHNRQILKKSFNSLHNFKKITCEVESCIEHNDIWLSGIRRALKEIHKKTVKSTNFSVDIYIYNPSNTIQTINLFIKSILNGEDPNEWIPRYYIDLLCDGILYKYYGCLVESSNSIRNTTLQEVLNEFYGGSEKSFLIGHTFGGYDSRDFQISSSYGLEYNNYLLVHNEILEQQQAYHFNGFSYVPSASIHPYQGFHNFLELNMGFCKEIFDFYNQRLVDGFFIVST